ncbi:MAG: CoA-binding protein [Phycisphaerae bacterium]
MAQRVVAVIGASSDPTKYGCKAVRAYLRRGWKVYPVTPRPEPIEGLKTYPSIADIPEHVHRATIYLPPALGLKLLDQIAAAKPDELFVNPGAESDELLAAARQRGLEPIVACSIVDIGERP